MWLEQQVVLTVACLLANEEWHWLVVLLTTSWLFVKKEGTLHNRTVSRYRSIDSYEENTF